MGFASFHAWQNPPQHAAASITRLYVLTIQGRPKADEALSLRAVFTKELANHPAEPLQVGAAFVVEIFGTKRAALFLIDLLMHIAEYDDRKIIAPVFEILQDIKAIHLWHQKIKDKIIG